MTREERDDMMRRAVDVAARVAPEGWRYTIESTGMVRLVAPDGYRGPPPADIGLPLRALPHQGPGGWFGGERTGHWLRTWSAQIDGVEVNYLEARSVRPAEYPRPADDEATP